MSRLNADVIIALLLMILSAALFADTFSYQKVHLSIIGAKLWPRVVLVALFVASTVFLFGALAKAPAAPSERRSASRWISDNRKSL